MTADLHTLTGAYALDALSEQERTAFEEHLAQCPACTSEVAELQETAARLGGAVAATAPESLKPAVLARIGQVRQLPPERDDAVVLPLRRKQWPTIIAAITAAAAVIAAVLLGVQVIGLDRELERTQGQLAELDELAAGNAELAELLAATDARVVPGGGGGASGVVVVSERLDKLAFVPRTMPAPAADKTYQLWLIGDYGARSAGLMAGTDRPVITQLDRRAKQFGVTIEPAGGSRHPSKPLLLFTVV